MEEPLKRNEEPLEMNLAEIEAKLNALTFSEGENENIQSESRDFLHNPYINTAAVLVFYDPETLQPFLDKHYPNETIMHLPLTNSDENAYEGSMTFKKTIIPDENKVNLINELIGVSELVLCETGQDGEEKGIRFMLKSDYRKLALKEMIASNQLKNILEITNSMAKDSGSELQFVLTEVLEQTLPPLDKLSLSKLAALQKVREWLKDAPLDIPTEAAIASKISKLELLDTFRLMTGRVEDGVFNEYFRGRIKELAVLRKYAGVAAPVGFAEAAMRVYHNIVEPIFNWQSKPPLLLYGIGGVGKSSLLAKFLLDHAQAHEEERFPFVYLDFDRPLLDVFQPESLLVEAARQLSIQYSDEEEGKKFQEFYNLWKNRTLTSSVDENLSSVSLTGNTSSSRIRENREIIVAHFTNLMKSFSKNSGKPFLMVIHTFEEVQHKGEDCVKDLYHYLEHLQNVYPMLRLVVSGRVKVTTIKTQELELKELDEQAASGFLEKYGITDRKAVENIISAVGRNPLSLKLAVDLVKRFGVEELEELKTKKKSLYIFPTRFPDMQIQGILYNRILGHIRNKQVRDLAHPGLILRIINAELIFLVLNNSCGLKLKDISEGEVLFEELKRELSLITLVDSRTVRHRTDVRKAMLGLIMKDKPKIVEVIHQDAISYYSAFSDVSSRAEEIYHRLCLNQRPTVIEDRWVTGVEIYLSGAIDELPLEARRFLGAKMELSLSESIAWDEQDIEISERRIVKRAVQLLNTGNGDKVLDLLGNTNEKAEKSALLQLIKARAELQLKKIEEASNTIQFALTSIGSAGMDIKIMDEFGKMRLDIEKGKYYPSALEREIPGREDDQDEENDEFYYDF